MDYRESIRRDRRFQASRIPVADQKEWEGEDTIVGYHIADDKYNKGEPIARACTYYAEGRLKKVTGGWFTVRLWGKACFPTNYSRCDSLKGGLSNEWLMYANVNGYSSAS